MPTRHSRRSSPARFVTIFGQNLGTSTAALQVTLNEAPVVVAFANGSQINVLLPAGFPTGPATLRLSVSGVAALPVTVQIDTPPPTILTVNTPANAPLAGSSAAAGDVLNVQVTGLDPSVVANPSRLKVTISGMPMTIQQVTALSPGAYQIQITVNQSFGASLVPLAVWVDGVSSTPLNVTVR